MGERAKKVDKEEKEGKMMDCVVSERVRCCVRQSQVLLKLNKADKSICELDQSSVKWAQERLCSRITLPVSHPFFSPTLYSNWSCCVEY